MVRICNVLFLCVESFCISSLYVIGIIIVVKRNGWTHLTRNSAARFSSSDSSSIPSNSDVGGIAFFLASLAFSCSSEGGKLAAAATTPDPDSTGRYVSDQTGTALVLKRDGLERHIRAKRMIAREIRLPVDSNSVIPIFLASVFGLEGYVSLYSLIATL